MSNSKSCLYVILDGAETFTHHVLIKSGDDLVIEYTREPAGSTVEVSVGNTRLFHTEYGKKNLYGIPKTNGSRECFPNSFTIGSPASRPAGYEVEVEDSMIRVERMNVQITSDVSEEIKFSAADTDVYYTTVVGELVYLFT